MAVSMLQSRALSGCRAFTPVRTGAKPERAVVAHGARRKDSFMVEVNLSEEDTEDFAVRSFMNCVMESKVLDQLRWRRYKETNQERIKRRIREGHEIRKTKFVEKDWAEWYGQPSEPHVFDQYFTGRNPEDGSDEEIFMDEVQPNENIFADLVYNDQQGGYAGGSQGSYMNDQGGYMNQQGGYTNQGGYMNQQGGYINDQGGYMNQQGGYMNNQGGYMTPQQQGGYVTDPNQQGGYMPQSGYAANPNQQGGYMPQGQYAAGSQGGYQGQAGYLQPGAQQQQQDVYYTQQSGGQFVQQPGQAQ